MKEVKHGTLCPISDVTAIASPKCQKCENYISHELIGDEHGRTDSIKIGCKLFKKEEEESLLKKLITQLDAWIAQSDESVEKLKSEFPEAAKMFTNQSQAYWNVKQFIEINKEG